MALAAAAARAEAGRDRRLSQVPWNLVIGEAAVREGEELGRPEGARREAGSHRVRVSWRSWQRSSNPWDVRAGAFKRKEREPGPRPRKRQAHAASAEGPGGREGAERRRQHWAGPRWVAAARRLGRRLEPRLPVCERAAQGSQRCAPAARTPGASGPCPHTLAPAVAQRTRAAVPLAGAQAAARMEAAPAGLSQEEPPTGSLVLTFSGCP
ncbi:uncharacterized protein LOC120609194 [Pteropus medius]|uniref:uncharacterized protein LOC120609194 n=1 Tax=Pteropus vampyrus TaxID=132908 RepID=UPI00196A8FC5|nr:uncharacterized protein LOC120609194 [Pteropus giganteus]